MAEVERAPDADGQQHPSRVIEPFGNFKTEIASHQGLRLVTEDVVKPWANLPRDLKDVTEAFGGDQCRLRAFPLYNRIGRYRRAVNVVPHVTGRHRGFP